MTISHLVIENLTPALEAGDLSSVQSILSDVSHLKGKHSRESAQCMVNTTVVTCAIQKNQPEFITLLREIPQQSVDSLVLSILEHYVATGDKRWIPALDHLSWCPTKKSVQSRIIAKCAEFLISSGISHSDSIYIADGLDYLTRISFKKYRSDCIIRSAPRLIEWAADHDDPFLLRQVRVLLKEVTDASKRAQCYSDLARAYATVAVHRNEFSLFLDSIRIAAEIPQNLKRKESVRYSIGTGMNSGFRNDLLSIQEFLSRFSDLPEDVQDDLLGALIDQFLALETDTSVISSVLASICNERPSSISVVILELLSKAEHSGESRYLAEAVRYLCNLSETGTYPIREIIRAGVAVARNAHSSAILLDLLQHLEEQYPLKNHSGIYLQFSQSVLLLGDFPHAVQLFEKISGPTDNVHQYSQFLLDLTVEGVLHDQSFTVGTPVFKQVNSAVSAAIVPQAVSRIVHTLPFTEIVNHRESFKQLIASHPDADHLFLDTVTCLANRGFLEAWDSSVLVDFAKSIQDRSLREQAISRIVVNLAEMGVRTQNRDFLQHAVGITCLIDDQQARSATMSQIIDKAALFAATQGDLDLLLRMRSWSGLLLDRDLVSYAMQTITDGVLKYAIATSDPQILDEAYRVAQDIDDPSLKTQICERIAEAFVRIGCDRIEKSVAAGTLALYQDHQLLPFEKGLALLKTEIRNPHVSIKISRMIDIILLSSKKDLKRYYLLPLAQYTLEIENSCERDAMMTRIVSGLGEELDRPDSSDPYESLAYLLLEHYNKRPDLRVIGLIKRLLELAHNPFTRLRGFCILADSALRINEPEQARRILDETFSAVAGLPAEHQKIQILAGLTVGYLQVDPVKAQQCLKDSLAKLPGVEPENDAVARRRIIMAVAGFNEVLPSDTSVSLVLDIAKNISNPSEYVRTLILAYPLVQKDKEKCIPVIRTITDAIDKIESPYDQILLLLEVVPLAIESCDENMPLYLLKKVDLCSKTLNIPYISDTLHGEVARLLAVLSKKQKNPSYLEKAAQQLFQIDDDELRQIRLSQIGYEDTPERKEPFSKIMGAAKRAMKDGCPPGQISALESAVRTVPDRSRQALVFCRLSIQFREQGDVKLSKRMLSNAVQESGIIRPLSKRAFVRCNLAMKMYAAGYEHPAQELLDSAIDTATNIRQSSLRDEVFDELGLAIQIMQGMRE